MKMTLDHLTAVVTDADAAADVMSRLLGAAPVATVVLPGMSIRSFRLGDAEVHLNAPTGPGPIEDHHRLRGPGYHHLALRVDDLDAAIAELPSKGFAALGAAVETAPGLREVFLDPKTTGGLLIQLVERRAQSQESYSLDAAAVSMLADQMDRKYQALESYGASAGRRPARSENHRRVRDLAFPDGAWKSSARRPSRHGRMRC